MKTKIQKDDPKAFETPLDLSTIQERIFRFGSLKRILSASDSLQLSAEILLELLLAETDEEKAEKILEALRGLLPSWPSPTKRPMKEIPWVVQAAEPEGRNNRWSLSFIWKRRFRSSKAGLDGILGSFNKPALIASDGTRVHLAIQGEGPDSEPEDLDQAFRAGPKGKLSEVPKDEQGRFPPIEGSILSEIPEVQVQAGGILVSDLTISSDYGFDTWKRWVEWRRSTPRPLLPYVTLSGWPGMLQEEIVINAAFFWEAVSGLGSGAKAAWSGDLQKPIILWSADRKRIAVVVGCNRSR